MERLFRIGAIMDARLTTEALEKVYPKQKKLEEKTLSPSELESRHKQVEIALFEMADNFLREEKTFPLTTEELVLVCRRVQTFLVARGFLIKKTF